MAKESKSSKPLDRIDRNILRELQNNARISYVDLGERVGLSTSPCLERVKRLEKDGYINGYTARLEPAKLGAGLLIFVEISLTYTSGTIFEDFKQAVKRWPQIQECHLVSGGCDYLLKVRIEDMSAYRELLGEILHTLPGVRESQTMVVMETVAETASIALK